jgi:serine/threonine protein phosphatase PrpC
MTTAFADTNREVYGMVTDVRFSGSTCVSVLTFGRKIYVSNVGDSRAILIKSPSNQPASADPACK